MTGLTQLSQMLSTLSPELDPLHYVFTTREYTDHSAVDPASGQNVQQLDPLFTFRETEGETFVLSHQQAEVAGFDTSAVFARITLKVHSSLEAVGLTAAVSAALTEHNIPANVVAAFYHDHVFVPVDRALDALAVLEALSAQAQESADTPNHIL